MPKRPKYLLGDWAILRTVSGPLELVEIVGTKYQEEDPPDYKVRSLTGVEKVVGEWMIVRTAPSHRELQRSLIEDV